MPWGRPKYRYSREGRAKLNRPSGRSARRFRRFRRYRKAIISRKFAGFPKSMVTKLRYHDFTSVNPGAGTVGAVWYRCNGLNDPETAAGGGQPMGFDQWALVYDQYVVLGAKITVRFRANETTILTGGIIVDNDATLSGGGTVSQLIESGRSVYKTFLMSTTNGFGNMFTLSRKWSAKKWFGVKNIADAVNDMGATVSTDPTRTAHFGVWCGATDEASDPSNVDVDILIEYIVKFSIPKDLARS